MDYTEWKFKLQEIWSANWEISVLLSIVFVCLFFISPTAPPVAQDLLIHRFLDQTQIRTTVARTPLDERSARCRDLYLTTHTTPTTDRHPFPRLYSNLQSQQTSGRTHTTRTARPLGTAVVCLRENRKERATVAWAARTEASRIERDKVSELISVFLTHEQLHCMQ